MSMSPVNIPTPIFTLEQKAAASLIDYCGVYLSQDIHPEPEVHQFTIHGRFGNRMQEGLAQMMRGGPGAFPHFHQAFDLVQPLLSDCHPMSLAQLNGFVLTDTLPSRPILGVPFLVATCTTAVHGYLESSGCIGNILR
ncbi:hypothetical protein FVER14953_07542 [Fusarium verticillioides]|nr:hypothetical protein FVER14953_07542 [Fusarium verticillioides]